MNWVGLLSFCAGAWLIGAALLRRRRVVAAARNRQGAATSSLHPSLARIRRAFRPIVLAVLAYVGIKATLAYFTFDAGRFFSVFDLAGFLFLLAAYGTWIVLRMKYRDVG